MKKIISPDYIKMKDEAEKMKRMLEISEKYPDIIMDDGLKHALFCWNRMALFCKCWGNPKKKITYKSWLKTNPDLGNEK